MDFDQLLKPGSLDAANWSWRYGNLRFVPTAAVAIAARVTVDATAGPGDPGPDVCSYDPPPFDVRSLDDVAAVAFAAFPISS